MRDLWRWTADPLRLLEERAGTGPVFGLRLWRPALVGYRPDWNRAILGDLDTFRSAGSLSGLTPYLDGGVVASDVPEHDRRRRALDPSFHRQALAGLAEPLRTAVDGAAPAGTFEALSWSATVVRRMLNAAFFGGRFPDRLLARYLAPLHRPTPAPMLPRPVLFARVRATITRLYADPVPGTLGAALSTVDGGVEETRVALAAGYDTTAHTLAFALRHLAQAPEWLAPQRLPQAIDEVLRLYPAGWIGSRVATRDTVAAGTPVPAGTLVLYSPWLTHRDPDLWPRPTRFRPERFDAGRPAWGFLPFAAGRRTCLGAALGRLMLTTALEPFHAKDLRVVSGDPAVRAGITLRPRDPLLLAVPLTGRAGPRTPPGSGSGRTGVAGSPRSPSG